MGVKTTTVTICTCDRCGFEQRQDDYRTGNTWGQVTIAWIGDSGGRSWSGDDAGSMTHVGKAWLCRTCAEDFYSFMKSEVGSD